MSPNGQKHVILIILGSFWALLDRFGTSASLPCSAIFGPKRAILKMDHCLQLQELWHLNGGGGETQTPSGEEQEDQLDEERCAGLQEVKRSRKAIENHSSAEALFSATGKNKNPELIVTVSN